MKQHNAGIECFESMYQLMDALLTEEACIAYLVHQRWAAGITCQCCGVKDSKFYWIRTRRTIRCSQCRKTFSVRKGTIFEDSKLAPRKWFVAMWLVVTNRKGIPSTQLAREIGVTQKTAWFMLNRIRQVAEAMRETVVEDTVEVDETIIGGKEENKHWNKRLHNNWRQGKQLVIGALQRNGRIITQGIAKRDLRNVASFIYTNVDANATLYTDEHHAYQNVWSAHHTIDHSQYQYTDGDVCTNGIESFWAILKRGNKGVYHQWSKKHLERYLREFEYRWNMREKSEGVRLATMLATVNNTRLTYRELIA